MKRLWYGLKSFWVYLLLALVFGTILIVFFVSLQKDQNLATPVLAFSTVILAIATVLTIINSNEQEKRRREEELAKEKRDRKERLLNEIIEWGLEIQQSSLGPIPTLTAITDPQTLSINVEANTLIRYAIPFLRNEYIEAIARHIFEKDLQNNVEQTIRSLTAFMFLKEKSFGIKNPQEAFRGTYVTVIEEIDKEITEGRKTTGQLLYEYSEKLAKSTHELLVTVGKIKASLFAS